MKPDMKPDMKIVPGCGPQVHVIAWSRDDRRKAAIRTGMSPLMYMCRGCGVNGSSVVIVPAVPVRSMRPHRGAIDRSMLWPRAKICEDCGSTAGWSHHHARGRVSWAVCVRCGQTAATLRDLPHAVESGLGSVLRPARW